VTKKTTPKSDLTKKIKDYMKDNIQPILQMDGGDVEFISYEDGILKIRLQGACAHCPSAQMTLKFGIENRIKSEIPEVKEVIAV